MLHGTEPEDGFFAEASPANFWAIVDRDWDCFFCKALKLSRGRVVDVSCGQSWYYLLIVLCRSQRVVVHLLGWRDIAGGFPRANAHCL